MQHYEEGQRVFVVIKGDVNLSENRPPPQKKNPSTPRGSKLQCASFAERVLNWSLLRWCSLKIDSGNGKGALKGRYL